jgi:hypothetical protein
MQKIDVSSFREDRNLISEIPPITLLIKGFDQDQINSKFRPSIHKNGTGIIGSNRTATKNSRNGDVFYIKTPLRTYEKEFYKRDSNQIIKLSTLLKGHKIFNPRHAIEINDELIIVGDNQIIVLNKKKKSAFIHEYKDGNFSTTHYCMIVNNELHCANSGTDTISIVSLDKFEIKKRVLLRKYYPYSLDGRKIYSGNLSNTLIDVSTASQTTHPNALLSTTDHRQFGCLFGTFTPNKSQEGSGGKIIEYFTDNRKPLTLINGLSNPHDLQSFNNKYLLVESSADCVNIYSKDFILEKIYDLSNLEKFKGDIQRPWLQSVTPINNDLLLINDPYRSKIHIINIQNKTRDFINIEDPKIVLHKIIIPTMNYLDKYNSISIIKHE